MVKKVLVFVPHPDDEINIAGGLFENLNQSGVYTTVVVSTNGDYIPENTEKRFYEAKKAQRVLGYQELIFLGYGDGYADTHIYHSKNNEVVESHCGLRETYCAGDEDEYCYQKKRAHHSYTRENYKSDICSLIIEKKADIIICVDLDSHADHRCLSLLFDECMGEILKCNTPYRPIILKGFAYNGVWFGPSDFFRCELRQTTIELAAGEKLEKKSFPYRWEDRIQVKNGKNTITRNLFRNVIFKSLLAHKTQCDYYKVGFCALSCFPRIANPDTCYWYRSSSNMALYSKIEASSGDVSYVNDFMLAKPKTSITEDLPMCSQGWMPDRDDKTPCVSILFPREVLLTRIVLYQNLNSIVEIIRIKTDTGEEIEYNCLNKNVIVINIPATITKSLRLAFENINNHFTVNEIECFEEGEEFPWDATPFTEYKNSLTKRNSFINFIVKACFKVYVELLLFQSKMRAKNNK